ncbi:MAG: RecQ family zinc-binding domain-containing protein [Actinobacteria bacterium]|nr:RecQ family zinc-binding domain-containing protein [Actinomycetota bacterium]
MLLPRLPGDPGEVRSGADHVCETAALILQCAETLARLVDGDAGTSRGLDTAVARGRVVIPRLQQAAERYQVAGAALVDFAAEQEAAIQAADLAILRHERAGEELAALLEDQAGVRALAYHGGMKATERRDNQSAFMDGEVDVMVATTAFGMGIDKADVRYVIHYDVPESMDAYYQEMGRAGRDGAPALALLLWRPEDLGLRRFFAGGGEVGTDELERVAALTSAAGRPVDSGELAETAGVTPHRLELALSRLEDAGAVDVSAQGEVTAEADGPQPAEAAREAADRQDSRRQVEQSRLDMMRAYAEARSCRRRFVLTYFGEPAPRRCGNCDVCERQAGDEAGDEAGAEGEGAAAWPEQSRVVHPEWGEGLVLRRDGDTIAVLFDDAGYRTLSADLVADQGLLKPAP